MKKITALLIIASLALTLLVSCSKDAGVPDGMKKASGDAAAYTLYVPEDWAIDLVSAATSAHVSAEDRSNVSVTAWELENTDSTVAEWWDVNVDELGRAFTDFTLESEENTIIDGEAGVKYTYTAKLGDTTYKYMQAAAVHDSDVYVITYTAEPDVFDSHLESISRIITEFRFN